MIKTAERILKNYIKFKHLYKLSDKPFSIHGGKLAEAIETSVNGLNDTEKAILTNQYIVSKRERISRKQFCADNHISTDEYVIKREQALLNFEKLYLIEIENKNTK